MLQKIRENAQGLIVKFLIGFIAVGFVFFGVDFLGVGKTPPKAVVNGSDISQAEFRDSLERQRRLIQARMGEGFDPAMLQEERLSGMVIESLVQDRLLAQQADALKLSASRAMVDRVILQETAFQDNGVFSEARYRDILGRMGLSSAAYRSALADEIRQQHLVSGLVASEFETDAHFDQVVRLLRQLRDVRYITVSREQFAGKVLPDEAQVQAYYEAHPDEFMSEESVAIEYVQMAKADFYPEIDEAQLRARHEQEIAEHTATSERHAAHILLEVNEGTSEAQAMARIGELQERLAAGEDFATLAREYSQDPGSARMGGDVGYSSGDIFPPAFEAALAALAPGEVSGPVVTQAGVHLVKLLDVRQQQAPSFEESRPRIELAMKQEAAESAFVARVEQLADQVFTAPDLQQVASEMGLEVQRIDQLVRQGNTGVFAHPAVLAAAFNPELIASGTNSQVIELGDAGVIALRVTGHKPAALLAYGDARESALGKATAALEAQAMLDVANGLHKRLRDGADVETVALDAGYPWQVALAADRFSDRLPPALQARVFAVAAPPAGQRVIEVFQASAEDVLVLEVSGVRDGSREGMSPVEQAALRQFLVSDQGQLLTGLWQAGLRKAAEVRIN